MEEQRKLLAQLMETCAGQESAQQKKTGGDRRQGKYNRDTLCKCLDQFDRTKCILYLCSVCPHDVLANTKDNKGRCTHEHDAVLRAKYHACKAHGHHDPKTDKTLQKRASTILGLLIHKQDDKIKNLERKCDGDNDDESGTSDVEINLLETEISQHMKNSECFYKQGRHAEAHREIASARSAGKRRDTLIRAVACAAAAAGKNCKLMGMRPCDVCSASVPKAADAEWISNHRRGRYHQAWQQLRYEYGRLLNETCTALVPQSHPDARCERERSRSHSKARVSDKENVPTTQGSVSMPAAPRQSRMKTQEDVHIPQAKHTKAPVPSLDTQAPLASLLRLRSQDKIQEVRDLEEGELADELAY